MPPSGYSDYQASLIENFLLSCGKSLIDEGKATNRKPIAAISYELENISSFLNSDDFSSTEKSLFSLNASFYQLLAMSQPSTYEQLENALNGAAIKIKSGLITVEDRTRPILY